jgi:hypothetical protein
MAEEFNPYYTFLGLDEELTSPSHYQLLRLQEQESDSEKIQAAAAKAATRVRSHRPGEHAAQWATLLDEIQAAKECLLDPTRRQEYEQKRGRPSGPRSAGPAEGRANPASYAPAMTFVATAEQNFAYPPGVGPAHIPPTAASSPAPPHSPSPQVYPNPAPHAPASAQPYGNPAPYVNPGPPSDPMAPVLPPMAAPMSPMAYAWTSAPTLPACPAVAPPVAPTPAHHLDPMAPVAFGARHEPMPEAQHRIVGFALPAAHDPAIPFATPAARVPAAAVAAVSVAQAVDPASELAELPSKPIAARPMAKRPAKLPLMLVLGGGGAVVVLAGLLIAWNMKGNSEPKENPLAVKDPTKPSTTPLSPEPEPRPKPVVVQPEPMPQPEPASEPEPKPAPDPEPEPVKPVPMPEPAPEPMPTAAELAQLAKLLKEAKTALGDFNFAEATPALEQAMQVARLPEHQALVKRLQTVGDMAKRFRQAIEAAIGKLDAGDVIKVGASTEAAIVETGPDKLIIRVAGQNRTYTFNELPIGLAAAMGERAMNPDDPKTKLFKGAYVFVDKRTQAPQLEKVKEWWEEAQTSGVDASELLQVLEDDYDFAPETSAE